MDRHWWIAGAGSLAVVGGGLLLIDWLAAQPPLQLPITASPAHTVAPMAPVAPRTDTPPADALADGVLRQCRDGERVLYTDRACPHGVAARPVALHDTAGFQPLRLPRDAARVVPAKPDQPSAATLEPAQPTVADAASCGILLREIEYWDALARQPQSGTTQDWIRERRRAAQAAQHAAGC